LSHEGKAHPTEIKIMAFLSRLSLKTPKKLLANKAFQLF
jgi:hypothetical protein